MKNKTITIYELLGLIKEGKAPRRFCYNGNSWLLNEESCIKRYTNEINVGLFDWFGETLYQCLNDNIKILDETDDEFEDIEEIEQQDFDNDLDEDSKCECLREYYQQCEETINQLIRNQKKIIEKIKTLENDKTINLECELNSCALTEQATKQTQKLEGIINNK